MLIPVALFIFCSCTPSVVLNRQWPQTRPEGKTLAIIIPDKRFQVNYSGNVENEFGKGEMDALIRQNVISLIRSWITRNSCFSDAWLDKIRPSISSISIPVSGDPAKSTMSVPKDKSVVSLENRQADYILCFDKINVRSSISVYMNSGGSLLTASYSKDLTITTNFYIWDVNQRCLVVSGYTSNTKLGGSYTDRNDWLAAIDQTMREIFEKPSFIGDTITRVYKIGGKKEFKVSGPKNKINIQGSRIKWLIANLITKNDIDASDAKKVRPDFKFRGDKVEESQALFHYMNPATPGTEVDENCIFTKLFAQILGKSLPQFLPLAAPGSKEMRIVFETQLSGHFSKFDYPIDSLDNPVLNYARSDSTDYLIVFYTRFTQPKKGDKIDDLNENDLNFYCNIVKVGTNMSVVEYHGDLDDVLDYSDSKTINEAIVKYCSIAFANIKARMTW